MRTGLTGKKLVVIPGLPDVGREAGFVEDGRELGFGETFSSGSSILSTCENIERKKYIYILLKGNIQQ